MDKKRIKNKDSGVVVCWLLCICILDKKLVVWSDWLGKFWFVVVFVICILLSIVTCPINLPTLKVTPLSFSSEFTLKFLRTPFVLHVPFAWRGKLVWNRAKSTVIRKKKNFFQPFWWWTCWDYSHSSLSYVCHTSDLSDLSRSFNPISSESRTEPDLGCWGCCWHGFLHRRCRLSPDIEGPCHWSCETSVLRPPGSQTCGPRQCRSPCSPGGRSSRPARGRGRSPWRLSRRCWR